MFEYPYIITLASSVYVLYVLCLCMCPCACVSMFMHTYIHILTHIHGYNTYTPALLCGMGSMAFQKGKGQKQQE